MSYLLKAAMIKLMRLAFAASSFIGLYSLSLSPLHAFTPGSVPDDAGRPTGTTDAGSRDDCPLAQLSLRPLAPDVMNIGGYTISSQPTLWAYTPYALNLANANTGLPNLAEFRLETPLGEEVYETMITESIEAPAIVGILWPEEAPELEIGETYYWYIRVFCNTTEARGRAATASGWIQRVDPETLASEDVWYDRLTEFGTRLQANPNDSEARSRWNELLDFVEVEGLEDVPIVP